MQDFFYIDPREEYNILLERGKKDKRMKREVPLSFYIYYIINIFNCQFLFWFLPGSFAVFVSIFILFLGVFKWIFPRLKRVGYWRAGPRFSNEFLFWFSVVFSIFEMNIISGQVRSAPTFSKTCVTHLAQKAFRQKDHLPQKLIMFI